MNGHKLPGSSSGRALAQIKRKTMRASELGRIVDADILQTP